MRRYPRVFPMCIETLKGKNTRRLEPIPYTTTHT